MNEVEIKIGSTDKTEAGTKSAETRLKGLTKVGKTAAAGLATAGAVAGGLFAKGLADNMNIAKANDLLAGQLGLTADEAKKAGQVSGAVYAQNWGDSIDDVNDALKAVDTNISDVGTTSKQVLGEMTTDALALKQTFGYDVADSTEAVGAILKNKLAPNAKAAFDIVTAGAQNGVDKAGDLLDTFQEYSPQFSKLGISGKDALNLLSAGLKAGARDTDTIADGFKEFSIRAIDGSTLTAQGFKAVGLNAKDMGEKIGKGGDTARQALQQTLDGLLAIKDPVKQNIAGTALFGTQWEDTIRKILPAIAGADEEIQHVDGSTDKMANTIGDNASGKIETAKRKFEQWTQSMASSTSNLGLVTTAAMTFGGGAFTAASQAATMAMAMRGTALAEKAMAVAALIGSSALKVLRFAMIAATGPVGLTVLAVAAFVAIMVVAYKKSETFRDVCNAVFKFVGGMILDQISAIISVFGALFGVLGHLPGKAGAAFRSAQKAAQAANAKVKELHNSLNSLPTSKRVNIRVNTTYAVYGDKGGHYEGGTFVKNQAHGGIVGAATGGARGGLTWVGERGRELVRLPLGSTVIPHGGSENMAAAGMREGGDGVTTLVVEATESAVSQWLAEMIRKFVRAKGGGNVQIAFGKN